MSDPNNGGGYSNVISPLARYKRFLILGSYGSCYKPSGEMTQENLDNIKDLASSGVVQVMIDELVEVVRKRRAPKQEPSIAALAAIIASDNLDLDQRRQLLFDVLPEVCTTFSNLTQFFGYLRMLNKLAWGRIMRKAISQWILRMNHDQIIYQFTKFKNRNSFTPRDVLRLVHPRTDDANVQEIFKYICATQDKGNKKLKDMYITDVSIIKAYEILRTSNQYNIVMDTLVDTPIATWEHIGKQELLKDPRIWEHFVKNKLPPHAFLRNICRMLACNVDPSMITEYIDDRLIKNRQITSPHAISILQAYKEVSKLEQQYNDVIDRLEEAFFTAINSLPCLDKSLFVAIDVSGSMSCTSCVGMTNLNAIDAEAALVLSLMRTANKRAIFKMFSNNLSDVPFNNEMSIKKVLQSVFCLEFSSTDCSAPIEYALKHDKFVDCFIIMTDNETNANTRPPHQALAEYRNRINKNAKMVVMAFSASQFSIAEPDDHNMLDIAGVDASIWQTLEYFINS